MVGASVRAAAGSLRRAGCRPVAFDLFADRDLVALGEAHRLESREYPDGIWARVRRLVPIPWMFTGALENHPRVLASVSRRFSRTGHHAGAVRDPVRLAEVVRSAGLRAPAIRVDPRWVPTDGSWLIKPFASGGGSGIARWLGGKLPDRARTYFQEQVAGLGLAAVFVGDGSGAELQGVTRQYLGRPGNRFAYRGSLGPWPVTAPVGARIASLGHHLATQFGLVGVFGVDLIVDGERVWVIEVNPRYSASVEVLEYARGRSIVASHLRAGGLIPPVDPERTHLTPGASGGVVGKVVLFARWAGTLAVEVPAADPIDPWRLPEVADIPQAGSRFEAGDPILTVFGRGETAARCRLDLARQARWWRSWLEAPGTGAIRPGC